MKIAFILLRVISIIMLFSASNAHPYGFYNLLRIVVCATALYGFYQATHVSGTNWMWIFGAVAFLFNPIIPVHLTRDTWQYIDIGTAIVIFLSLFVLNKESQGRKE